MLFPVHCLLCGHDGFWICPQCLGKINLVPFQTCPYCEKYQSWKGETCEACRKKQRVSRRLDALLVGTDYRDRDIAKIIHFFKYNFISELSQPLGEILIKTFQRNSVPLPDVIIPVPLHPRRLKWRGFNQSELLARYLSSNLTPGMPIEMRNDVLIRKKSMKPQNKIQEFKRRLENIADVFFVQNADVIKRREILLVDDVATTGSTLFECAKELKKAGAKKVTGIVVARQNFSKNKV
jgi:competence protein ComFC